MIITNDDFSYTFSLSYNAAPGGSASCPEEPVKIALVFTGHDFKFTFERKEDVTPIRATQCDIQDIIHSLLHRGEDFWFFVTSPPGEIEQSLIINAQIVG